MSSFGVPYSINLENHGPNVIFSNWHNLYPSTPRDIPSQIRPPSVCHGGEHSLTPVPFFSLQACMFSIDSSLIKQTLEDDQTFAAQCSNCEKMLVPYLQACSAVLETLNRGHCCALHSVDVTVEGRTSSPPKCHDVSYQDFLTNTLKINNFPQIPTWPTAWLSVSWKKAMIASFCSSMTPQPSSSEY